MAGTDQLETQPKPAEGADERKPQADKGGGQGVSTDAPAEGGDDANPKQPGSPDA